MSCRLCEHREVNVGLETPCAAAGFGLFSSKNDYQPISTLASCRIGVLILWEDQYDTWLVAPVAKLIAFVQQFPAQLLMAMAEPYKSERKV
jgi:hypothetical protein